jgi:Ca-activated chloride channel family protein
MCKLCKLLCLICASSVSVFLAAAVAGDPQNPRPLNKHAAPAPDATRAESPMRVNVRMTLVPVTVIDQFGRNVTGLNKDNFKIYDGSEERPIATFGLQDGAVSIGLVFDCSRSMKDRFQMSRMAASQLFDELHPEEDEVFLVTVSNNVALSQDFTSNFGTIGGALTFIGPDGTTALLDGVYLALAHMKKAHNPMKALVIVSDGEDNNSQYNLREILRRAVESDVLIYTIGVYQNRETYEEMPGPQLLSILSAMTGGEQFVAQDASIVGRAMSTIGTTLHNQYIMGYYPREDAPSGKYRKIKVKLLMPTRTPRLQVYARTGYYIQ